MSTNQTIIEYKNGIIKNPINNYPINSFKIIGQIFVEEINKLCYQFSQILELDLSDCDIIKRYKQPKNTIELLQNFGTGEYVNKVITEFPRINFSLIERIVLPESIISISNQAFSDLFSLKEIILPNNLKDIGDEAFKNCINLQKIIVPKNIETIKRDTFNNCISLYYIYLSPNVHNIEKYAFKNCKSLRIIEGCANLVNIEKNAFLKCDLISENELCVKLQKNIPKVDFLSMGIQGFSLGILVSKSKIWTPKYGEIYCDKLSNPYIAGSVVCIPIYRESIIYTGHGLNIFDKQIRNTTDEFYYVLELLNSKDNESHISFSLSSTLKLHNKASNYIYEFEKFESDLIKFLIEEPPILNKQQIDILQNESVKYVNNIDLDYIINTYSVTLACHFRHKIGGDDTYIETYNYYSEITDIYLDTLLPNKIEKQNESGYCSAESMMPKGTIEGHQIELEEYFKKSAKSNYCYHKHVETIFNQKLKEKMNDIEEFYKLKTSVYTNWFHKDIYSNIPFKKDIDYTLK